MTKPLPSSPVPFPSPSVANEALGAFWADVHAAMVRHNIPHLAAVASAGAFPEFEKVGQGKGHEHELNVVTSIGRIGNDPKMHGLMAAILLRDVIDEEHANVEETYRRLVCGTVAQREEEGGGEEG